MNRALTNAPDLTKQAPRSPGEILGGYVLLARIIDKCRAGIAGTNGEYNFNCPLDRHFFEFTEIDAHEFADLVATGASDEQIADWCRDRDRGHSDNEIMTWSYEQRTRGPVTAEQKGHFESMRRSLVPDKHHIATWFQLLDADEGRF